MKNLIKMLNRIAGTILGAVLIFAQTTCTTDIDKSPTVITIAAIQGVTIPAAGITPITRIVTTEQYTGIVTWEPAVSGIFTADTAYTATITLTAKEGFTLIGVTANFFTVAGATSVSNAANSGIITAVFPVTGVINSIEDLRTYLSGLPSNTESTPYIITLNVNSLTGISNRTFSDKYVNLDLSGSTIITIPGNTFHYSYSLTGVIIPNGVISIGENAFSSCSSLTSVTIPNGVISIGESAFSSCSRLTSVTIPNSVISIGVSAFNSCSSLASITIPNSVISIGQRAFYGCSNLTAINVGSGNSTYTTENGVLYTKDKTILVAYPTGKTDISFSIPSNVTIIEESAFDLCSSLANVTIPNGVINIGQRTFYGCSNLTAINVDSGNSAYTAENGVLYNKDITVLFSYPEGKTDVSFIIPSSVNIIGEYAFRNCKNLNSVIIPNSVTSIGGAAFQYCTGLNSVTIPNSVTSIGPVAFNIINLISVTFECTISADNFGAFASFPGDLRTKYLSEGIGTYTTANPGSSAIWTKQ
jgi:hypothetical protein